MGWEAERLGWKGAQGPQRTWAAQGALEVIGLERGSSPDFTGKQTEVGKGHLPKLGGLESQGPGKPVLLGTSLGVHPQWLSILLKLCDLAQGWQG